MRVALLSTVIAGLLLANPTPADAYPHFSADAHHVYFARYRDDPGNIWVLSLSDGEERALTNFEGRHGRLANDAFSTDGQYLYFGWADATGDLWLMDVVTDASE